MSPLWLQPFRLMSLSTPPGQLSNRKILLRSVHETSAHGETPRRANQEVLDDAYQLKFSNLENDLHGCHKFSGLSHDPQALLFNPGYDKIIIQTPPLTSAFAYQMAALPFKNTVFSIVSDIWPSTAVDLGAMKKNSVSWKAFRFMELFLYGANSLIAQSIETRDYLESHGNKPKLLFRNLTQT